MPDQTTKDKLFQFRDRTGQPDDPLKAFRVTKDNDVLARFRGPGSDKKTTFKPFDKGHYEPFTR